MKRRTLIAHCAALPIFSGCSLIRRTPPEPTHAQRIGLGPVHDVESDIFRPGIGDISTTTVGTTMIAHTKARTTVAVVLKAPVLVDGRYDEDYRMRVVLRAGTYKIGGRDRAGNEYFNMSPLEANWIYRGQYTNKDSIIGDLKINTDGTTSLMWAYPGSTEFQEAQFKANGIERKPNHQTETEPRFRRELIYTGRSGSTINILYREFQNDMARPAFTQALQYDIAADQVIGYQGAKFKILAADNTSITFQMLTALPPL